MPKFLTKNPFLIVEILFFSAIFALTLQPISDPDIWFHLKSGEIILQKGIINYDVFSFVTQGREWFAYEWLFQVVLYLWQQAFGLNGIQFLVAIVSTISVFFFYLIYKKIFKLNSWVSLGLSFFYFASIYEYFTPRPQIFAYTFLIILIYLLLLYYIKNRNFLWLSIPLILLWSNLHGSMFLGVGLFLGFSLASLINFKIAKEKGWLKKFKLLSFFSLISTLCTILPPLGLMQYRLLIYFFNYRQTLNRFIDEWTPLTVNPAGFWLYTGTLIITLLIFVLSFWGLKRQNWTKALWTIAIWPLVLTPYLASRNIFLGYLVFSLILGFCASLIKFDQETKITQKLLVGFLVLLVTSHLYILWAKKQEQSTISFYYPVAATQFIKDQKLQGHMFNEYGFGGYLLYNLYPQQQVFFDGRTDLYICCEMPYTLDLALKKNLPNDLYKTVLDQLWNKYQISFVVMRTEKHVVLRKIGQILQDDPDWSLVFWDDRSEIFVRKNSQNDAIISQFGTTAATPYNKEPYRKGSESAALAEYQRMDLIADSAKSRNAIGYLLLLQKKYPEAGEQFQKAIALNPGNESPYMNLAELAAKDGDISKAIELYTTAKNLAPDRGMIYLRLGQLTLQKTEDLTAAKAIWQEGVSKTIDTDAKASLEKLLQN